MLCKIFINLKGGYCNKPVQRDIKEGKHSKAISGISKNFDRCEWEWHR